MLESIKLTRCVAKLVEARRFLEGDPLAPPEPTPQQLSASKRAIAKLKNAGYEPRSYSGRGMHGAYCVGVQINRQSETDVKAVQRLLRGSRTEGLGMGTIVYWPKFPWPESKKAGLHSEGYGPRGSGSAGMDDEELAEHADDLMDTLVKMLPYRLSRALAKRQSSSDRDGVIFHVGSDDKKMSATLDSDDVVTSFNLNVWGGEEHDGTVFRCSYLIELTDTDVPAAFTDVFEEAYTEDDPDDLMRKFKRDYDHIQTKYRKYKS